MIMKDMEKNLLATGKNNQQVRVQYHNHLYVGTVESISSDVLKFKTSDGKKSMDMNRVMNYKLMK